MIPEPRLKNLYQEVILDHNRNPRNFGPLSNATQYSHGHNPLCGDDYHLHLKINEQGKIENATFEGKGCAISKSSASIMTTLIKGKAAQEAADLNQSFIQFMTADAVGDELRKKVDRMSIFEGVKEFPIRVKCATLAWHALEDALKDTSKQTR